MGRSLAVVCLIALAGCSSALRPAQMHSDPLRMLALHHAMRERVQSIQAEARVDQRGEEGRIKGTVLMFVQRPARVRFDAMTQFGPVAILTSDGEHFAYSDLREKKYLYGETCPQNISRLLGIPMTVEQTTVLLLGGTFVIDHDEAEVGWSDEDECYRVTLRGEGGQRQVVDMGIREADMKAPPRRQRLRLLRSEIYDARGRSVWRATYDDYRVLQSGTYGVAMPFRVRVEQPASGTDTLIKFKEVSLQAQVPEGAFEQTPRAGMQVEEALCE
jgi:hypothetical protein